MDQKSINPYERPLEPIYPELWILDIFAGYQLAKFGLKMGPRVISYAASAAKNPAVVVEDTKAVISGTREVISDVSDYFIEGMRKFGFFEGKGVEKFLNPNEIRFSQESVSYLKNRSGKAPYTLDDITHSMSSNGWQGTPIDVIKMPEGGYTSIDNTRILAARRSGIDVKVTIRNYNERLPSNMAKRFEHPMVPGAYAQTWGEALEYRIFRQGSDFQNTNFPLGSYEKPRVSYPRN